MTDKEKLVLGPLYPEDIAAERRAFLDKAALAALPAVLYADVEDCRAYFQEENDGESDEESAWVRFYINATKGEDAKVAYLIAAAMLAERDQRRADEAKP